MFTVFRNLENNTITQIPHSEVTTGSIENLTKTSGYEDYIELAANPSSSFSAKDIDVFNDYLLKFVEEAPDNNRAPISGKLFDKGSNVQISPCMRPSIELHLIPDKDKTEFSLGICFRYEPRVGKDSHGHDYFC
jgi:hypothetical protein